MCTINYKCDLCNSFEVKLWREYGVFETKLYCFTCIEKIKWKENPNWKFENKNYIIDWFVPAVLSENGNEFLSIHDNGYLINWMKLEPIFE